MKRLGYFAPLVVLVLLGLVFLRGLGDGAGSGLDNALEDKAIPAFPETILTGYTSEADIQEVIARNELTLVNYFASWCGPCRAEHPQLQKLADQGVPVIGINFKDKEPQAVAFLEELGNPYTVVYTDDTGRTAIDWGVSGVPETFFVDSDGIIIDRFFGPITPAGLSEKLDQLGIEIDS